MQVIGPAPFYLSAAAEGLRGIVSPVLLLVCKQIYYEDREYLERNQWRLNRWCIDPVANILRSMMEDDKGLSDTPSPWVKVNFDDERRAMSWLATYKPLFQRGSIKSNSLKWIKKYPADLYSWVYIWSWVTTMTLHMLDLEEWEGFGIRVSARDPRPFERGTMIVFERVSADGGAGDRLSAARRC
ncbi:hypothetical protein PoHVEF18_006424 [Penicillium ochrochloron]